MPAVLNLTQLARLCYSFFSDELCGSGLDAGAAISGSCGFLVPLLPDVPFEFMDKVMDVIKSTSRHTYLILTKRAERMAEYFATRAIPKNAWLGVTVDVKNSKNRIDYLRHLYAPVRFLSCEPLLEDLGELNLENID